MVKRFSYRRGSAMKFRVGVEATALLGQRSGVGNYTARLLRAMLQQAQPEWDFLLFSNRNMGPLDSGLERAVVAGGRLTPSRWLWVQLRLATLARRNGCDVLHCPNVLGPLRSSTPIVLTIHDLSLLRYPQYHPRWRVIATGRFLSRLAHRATAVLAISEFTRAEIVEVLKLPAEKVHTIHCAAAEIFRPVTDAARLAAVRRQYRLPDRFVLFVGTLEPRKNLHRLVRAFGQARQRGFPHTLILAGRMGWLMDGFEHEIERLGMREAIRLLGYVPEADLPALYSLAELSVYPSLYEGFGLPTIEAMACGTPVLASNNSALAEVCGDAAWCVDPLDQEGLADALCALLGNREHRAELSRKGLARVQDFSWQRAARETMSVYRCAAHRPARGARNH